MANIQQLVIYLHKDEEDATLDLVGNAAAHAALPAGLDQAVHGCCAAGQTAVSSMPNVPRVGSRPALVSGHTTCACRRLARAV